MFACSASYKGKFEKVWLYDTTLDTCWIIFGFDLLIYESFSLETMAHVNNFPKLETIFYSKIQWSISSIESDIYIILLLKILLIDHSIVS